ncbi:MAG: DNA mismatch repair endonuclease MutL [Bacteroidetes bacterium]|nr:DNA mismatch repair endonuclease MutL [Bacteroidota bacterium]MCH8034239.1 DNA mismatch repair endonuclease MutL [Bacteroidota bacterium]
MSENKIQILPENIASKIAAGEVIQRPDSVVKELLENAIDADAKNIEVIVKKAGKNLIQVCDDGVGMSEQDVLLCVQKHATSKIKAYEDLEVIKTLGFRGEALSSMMAVAQIEIKTETKDDELGTLLNTDEQGNLIKEKGSFSKGTCLSVKNLFFNTPARRKFLKSDATELKHIIDTFNKTALSHPQITFKFYNNDDLIFDFQGGSLGNRIKQVFADNMLDALIPVDEQTDYLSITGFIGKPSLLKKSKGEQYLFLNDRYIISRQINHAVFTAYENLLEKGDYPFFILFLKIDPEKTDVNVHPSKLEAKFDDEKSIYNFTLAVVKKSLGTHDLVPSMVFSEEVLEEEKLIVDRYHPTKENDFSDRPSRRNFKTNTTRFTDEEIDRIFSSITDDVITRSPDEPVTHPFDKKEMQEVMHTLPKETRTEKEEASFIFQLHNKYILSQIKTGLMIIDQHVAHERILYEKALNRFEADIPFSQQLLFPRTVQLDPGRYELIQELYPYLNKLGFEIKLMSKNKIVIEGVPDDVKNGSEEKVLLEIIEEYTVNERENKLEQKDNLAKSYSCRTAIKAGDKLSDTEMRLLIDQLFATSMPYACPHGRPIVVKISLIEFDRRFGRT